MRIHPQAEGHVRANDMYFKMIARATTFQDSCQELKSDEGDIPRLRGILIGLKDGETATWQQLVEKRLVFDIRRDGTLDKVAANALADSDMVKEISIVEKRETIDILADSIKSILQNYSEDEQRMFYSNNEERIMDKCVVNAMFVRARRG